VSRWRRLLPVLAVLGCSGLDEGDGGVVALQVEVPVPPDVEVGDTLQLHATALDANGDPVDVAISWQAADPTVSVNATGLVTGVSAGTGRVQAREGSLGSNVVTLTVIARADTLLLLGDSIREIHILRLAARDDSALPSRPASSKLGIRSSLFSTKLLRWGR